MIPLCVCVSRVLTHKNESLPIMGMDLSAILSSGIEEAPAPSQPYVDQAASANSTGASRIR